MPLVLGAELNAANGHTTSLPTILLSTGGLSSLGQAGFPFPAAAGAGGVFGDRINGWLDIEIEIAHCFLVTMVILINNH